jgi:hypothetical protein
VKASPVAVTVAAGGLLAVGAGAAAAHGTDALSHAANSPGIGSGNNVQAPVDVPVNATGNGVGVVEVLSPVFGNSSMNP